MTSFEVFKDLITWLVACVAIGLIFRYIFWK